MIQIEIKITEENHNQRIDKVITKEAQKSKAELSRNRIQELIDNNMLICNGIIINNSAKKTILGQVFILEIPDAKPSHIKASNIALDITYEDDDLLVINKKAGMVTHPGTGNIEHTLVNALLAYCPDSLSGIGGIERPGIVHRLDKNTTGLIVVAKNDIAHQKLSEQLKNRSLKRTYHAIIWGILQPISGTIESYIKRNPYNRKLMQVAEDGKLAITHYKTLKTFLNGAITLVEFNLETGRTHQIRVHSSYKGHSLIGDPEYGHHNRKITRHIPSHLHTPLRNFGRQALHAKEIAFTHPTNDKYLQFTTELPDDMKELINQLEL